MFLRHLAALLLVLGIPSACATDAAQEPPTQRPGQRTDDGGIVVEGTDSSLDIMTWNLERFPKVGDTTIDFAAKAIEKLRVEVVALQEMRDTDALFELRDRLPGWKAVVANEYHYGSGQFYNPPVAILFDASSVTVTHWTRWFPDDELAFPRTPLSIDLIWKGHALTILDVHLKALGDDYIDEGNPYDEEMRRRAACEKLEYRLRSEYLHNPLVMVGDLNDRIDEPASTNVFMAFLSRPDDYRFATMPLAEHVTYATASYPKGPSMLDHVLVTRPLFSALDHPGTDVHTLDLETWYPNGWWDYEARISDHRPVLLRLTFPESTPTDGGIGEVGTLDAELDVSAAPDASTFPDGEAQSDGEPHEHADEGESQ